MEFNFNFWVCCSMVERCMRNKWFPTKTLNRVVAPFALSMTTVMLQKLSGERTLKQLEAFTNLHLFDRTKIQEGNNLSDYDRVV